MQDNKRREPSKVGDDAKLGDFSTGSLLALPHRQLTTKTRPESLLILTTDGGVRAVSDKRKDGLTVKE